MLGIAEEILPFGENATGVRKKRVFCAKLEGEKFKNRLLE